MARRARLDARFAPTGTPFVAPSRGYERQEPLRIAWGSVWRGLYA